MEKKALTTNIPSYAYAEDPFYRYKMPKMILKTEGKGNGIKTNIVNLVEVAKALRVPTDCNKKTKNMTNLNCSTICFINL